MHTVDALHDSSVAQKGFCSCDLSVKSDRGTYDWPEREAGQNISQMCQYGIVGQNITRICNQNLTWGENDSTCPTVVTYKINQLNAAIKNVTGCIHGIVSAKRDLTHVFFKLF